MTHFHDLSHGNCVLKYIGGIFELRKLYFGDLQEIFDVKKANFRGLLAKIGCLMPIWAFGIHKRPIFIIYFMGIVSSILEGFSSSENYILGGFKANLMSKQIGSIGSMQTNCQSWA